MKGEAPQEWVIHATADGSLKIEKLFDEIPEESHAYDEQIGATLAELAGEAFATRYLAQPIPRPELTVCFELKVQKAWIEVTRPKVHLFENAQLFRTPARNRSHPARGTLVRPNSGRALRAA